MLPRLVLSLSFATILILSAVRCSENDDIWLKQALQTSSVSARASKFDWTGVLDHPECPGDLMTLNPGDATKIQSHKSYGEGHYPEDYRCRWLVFPNGCQLNLVCDIGTPEDSTKRRRRRQSGGECSKDYSDYLRLVGYGGLVDTMFCGEDRLSIKLDDKYPLALMFKTQKRDSRQLGSFGDLLNLVGFSCNVVCQETATTTTATTTTASSTTTVKSSILTNVPTRRPEEFVTLSQGITRPPRTTTASTTTITATTTTDGLFQERCSCGGGRQGRIVCPVGHNCTAGLGSIPWQAALVTRNRIRPWCGGTIINDRYILTAAHCVRGKKKYHMQVVLGDHDWTEDGEVAEVRADVSEIITHPRFGERATFDYDFALLRLRNPLRWRDMPGVRPACLPDFRDHVASRQVGYASGWGVLNPNRMNIQATKLQSVAVRTMSNRECEALYQHNGSVTDAMMCASSTNGGDACFGDSGGPFVNEAGEVIGVVSWGKSCAKQKWPGVYARTSMVLDWITQNTRDARWCFKEASDRPRRRNDKMMHYFTIRK